MPASSAWAEQPPASVGPGGLPGVNRVLTMEPLSGMGLFAGAGYGFSGEALGMSDSHHRATGVVSVGLGLTRWLTLAARFDGRYDRHSDIGAPDVTEDGWVGDPRLVGQFSHALSDSLNVGALAVIWFPGANAPSVVTSAISGDLQLGASYKAMDGRLRLAANLGLRIDNSAASIENADTLSQADRLSLGLSDSNAVLVGLGAAYRMGRAEILGEFTLDKLIGDMVPTPDTSPARLAAGVQLMLSDTMQARVMLEANMSALPNAELGQPLAPFEPRVSVMTGLYYRWGGPKKQPSLTDGLAGDGDGAQTPTKPTSLSGRITSDSGDGLADAKVEIAIGEETRSAQTDAEGRFTIDLSDVDFDVSEIEEATVVVTAEGYKSSERPVDLTTGEALSLDVQVEVALPRGQLRGVVRAYNGKPISGTITVEPIGLTAKSAADGTFELDVPPGQYTVTIKAKGFKGQRRKVDVQDGGVTILHIDMRRGR